MHDETTTDATDVSDAAQHDDAGAQAPTTSLRAEISPASMVLAAAVAAVTVWAGLVYYEDPAETPSWFVLAVVSPGLVGMWLVMELLWRPSPLPLLGAFVLRAVWFGLAFALLCVPLHLVGWERAAEAARKFPNVVGDRRLGVLSENIIGFTALGYIAWLGGALLALLAVNVPYLAVQRPRDMAGLDDMSVDDADPGRARWTGCCCPGWSSASWRSSPSSSRRAPRPSVGPWPRPSRTCRPTPGTPTTPGTRRGWSGSS